MRPVRRAPRWSAERRARPATGGSRKRIVRGALPCSAERGRWLDAPVGAPPPCWLVCSGRPFFLPCSKARAPIKNRAARTGFYFPFLCEAVGRVAPHRATRDGDLGQGWGHFLIEAFLIGALCDRGTSRSRASRSRASRSRVPCDWRTRCGRSPTPPLISFAATLPATRCARGGGDRANGILFFFLMGGGRSEHLRADRAYAAALDVALAASFTASMISG